MKGIILSGGTGSRLYPLTVSVNKQLLPVFDKPMIYYPLSTLISEDIREIMIISTPSFLPAYKRLLGDGSHLGLKIKYKPQPEPKGIAQSFLIAEDFIGSSDVALILGDNIFHGCTVIQADSICGSLIFAYEVNNPQSYGIVEFDIYGRVMSIEEKPSSPKSKYAVPGLYFYDNNVVKYTKKLKPSKRGELEITDLNKMYLDNKLLTCQKMERGTVWLDAGTPTTLAQASNYIQTIQERQGVKIACIEEQCYKSGFINKTQFKSLITKTPKSEYRNYLESVI
jgi:glucose-1-phosphate thymidylyltransferase